MNPSKHSQWSAPKRLGELGMWPLFRAGAQYFLVLEFLAAAPRLAFAYGPLDCGQEVATDDRDIGNALLGQLCRGASSRAVAQCYFKAFTLDSGMGRGLAIGLCHEATSFEPLSCYANVAKMDAGIGRGLAVGLCGKATSQEPLSCYASAFKVDRSLGRGLAINLCAESRSAARTVQCYTTAGASGKSRQAAIGVCASVPPGR